MRPSTPSLVNILVPVKRAIDYAVKIRIANDGKGVDTTVKHSMNPFDEIAVEEALRLREKNPGSVTSITALTIGPAKSLDTLRTALAMGADFGVHIVTPDSGPSSNPEPISVAHAIKRIIAESGNGAEGKIKTKDGKPFELVIMGKQAIDDDSGSTGGMLAGMLGWSQGTFASELKVDKDAGTAAITREIDGGLEKIEAKLPLIVTTDLRLNEPRYASLPNIMKAKKKKVESFKPDDLGLDFTPRMEVLSVSEPPKRVGGGKVESVDELIAKMKEAGVI